MEARTLYENALKTYVHATNHFHFFTFFRVRYFDLALRCPPLLSFFFFFSSPFSLSFFHLSSTFSLSITACLLFISNPSLFFSSLFVCAIMTVFPFYSSPFFSSFPSAILIHLLLFLLHLPLFLFTTNHCNAINIGTVAYTESCTSLWVALYSL